MRISIKPRTNLGRWSILSIGGLISMFLIFGVLVTLGQRGGDTFFENVSLAIPFLLAGIFGVTAFVIGIISIAKRKERSILVVISTTIGFFVLASWIGEVAFPH